MNPKCPLLPGPQEGMGRWVVCWLHDVALRWGGQESPFSCSAQAMHSLEPIPTASCMPDTLPLHAVVC